MERRTEPRFPVSANGHVALLSGPEKSSECNILDISATGIRVLTDLNLMEHDIFCVEFKDHLLVARVVNIQARGSKSSIGAQRIYSFSADQFPGDEPKSKRLRGLLAERGWVTDANTTPAVEDVPVMRAVPLQDAAALMEEPLSIQKPSLVLKPISDLTAAPIEEPAPIPLAVPIATPVPVEAARPSEALAPVAVEIPASAQTPAPPVEPTVAVETPAPGEAAIPVPPRLEAVPAELHPEPIQEAVPVQAPPAIPTPVSSEVPAPASAVVTVPELIQAPAIAETPAVVPATQLVVPIAQRNDAPSTVVTPEPIPVAANQTIVTNPVPDPAVVTKEAEPAPTPKKSRKRLTTLLGVAAALIVTILGAVAFLKNRINANPPESRPIPAAVSAATPSAPVPVQPAESTSESKPAEPTSSVPASPDPASPPPVPPVSAPVQISSPAPQTNSAAPNPAPTTTASKPAAPNPTVTKTNPNPASSASTAGAHHVRITINSSCWIGASADGKTVIGKLFPKGTPVEFDFSRYSYVHIGNINGIGMEMDGQLITFPAGHRALTLVELTPSGMRVLPWSNDDPARPSQH